MRTVGASSCVESVSSVFLWVGRGGSILREQSLLALTPEVLSSLRISSGGLSESFRGRDEGLSLGADGDMCGRGTKLRCPKLPVFGVVFPVLRVILRFWFCFPFGVLIEYHS